MELASLKKLEILEHMTDEELRNIKYLQVYGHEAHGRYSTERTKLSALFVTHDDDVFGAGFNSMVGWRFPVLRFNKVMKNFKVDALSGLGIIKIVVGSSIGAALSSKGEVYTWGCIGNPAVEVENDENIVLFESYVSNKTCIFCLQSREYVNYTQEFIGSTSISRCLDRCMQYPTYTTDKEPYRTLVRWFVKFSVPILCPKCENLTSPKPLNLLNFHFCMKCNMMVEVPDASEKDDWVYPKSSPGIQTPQKLKISETCKIRNIYCGSSFLVMETSSDRLLFKGLIGNYESQFFIFNPDNVRFKSVSCGGSFIAVISDKGELYTCGLGDKGQLGYEWTNDMGHLTLRKVKLECSVVKVCCGYSSTACLMSNGSIMCFGSNMQKHLGFILFGCLDSSCITTPTNIFGSHPTIFTDVDNVPFTNVFCAKTQDCKIFVWGKSAGPKIPEMQFDASEIADVLADMPFTYASPSKETKIPDVIC